MALAVPFAEVVVVVAVALPGAVVTTVVGLAVVLAASVLGATGAEGRGNGVLIWG